ncbi:MAG: nucleotide exchange factor GrpE [Oscillospiraceae bacterium]|nr:nucleotide exchange factor GrpE [Oscillospiraceae bacterium]
MSTEKKETSAEELKEEKTEEETKAETPKEKKPKKESKKEAEIRETAEKLINEEKEKYLRLAAEYDNFRKRSQKERESLYNDIKADTLLKFLPVYDNLERALKQATADEAYRKGVEMIMTQFNTTMEKLGVTEIEADGQKFDPTLHNAVMHIEDESFGENEVVEVFQKGFKLNDKVIRFAMVKVAN